MGYSHREPATSPQATSKTAQREGAGLDDARQPVAARRSDFVAQRTAKLWKPAFVHVAQQVLDLLVTTAA